MDEEVRRKQRYRNLLYGVNSISNEIYNLNNDLNILTENLEKNFKLNDEFICQNELTEIKNNIKSISNELRYTVIPNIRYKSY